MEECHKLLTDQVDDANLQVTTSQASSLGELRGLQTTCTQVTLKILYLLNRPSNLVISTPLCRSLSVGNRELPNTKKPSPIPRWEATVMALCQQNDEALDYRSQGIQVNSLFQGMITDFGRKKRSWTGARISYSLSKNGLKDTTYSFGIWRALWVGKDLMEGD
ncbi:hypothetical protein Tco_1237162 [Tanacetum coccineum]